MNRHAYIAELTQLLYYMAPWDRDAAVKKYDTMLENSSDPEALMAELGSPMKLAVTLSRGYEPSDPNAPKPEPEPEPVPEPPVPEAPVSDGNGETAAGEESDAEPQSEAIAEETPHKPDTESADGETEADMPIPEQDADPGAAAPAADTAQARDVPPEILAETLAEDDPAAGTDAPDKAEPPAANAPEDPEVPESSHTDEVEVQVVQISSDQASQAAKPAVPETSPSIVSPGGDEIFSEIFSAATQAQSAVTVGSPAGRPKPRPAVLVFYILACILVGVPVTVVLLAVDLMIFLLAAAVLVFGIYILSFFGLSGFPGPGNKLVILGVGILAVTAAIALAWLGVWFMRNATVGFPGFLVRFGREHGYSREGSL